MVKIMTTALILGPQECFKIQHTRKNIWKMFENLLIKIHKATILEINMQSSSNDVDSNLLKL